MTTKEEVLRIVKDAGFDMAIFDIRRDLMIVRLIELAKAQGAAEERQRWNANMPDWQYVFSRGCQRAHPHDEMNDECQEITKRLKAIRNRERKE